MKFAIALCVLLVLNVVLCDVYMHNPRGSNDRNCERNTNRNNDQRLFNSQNNAKGGYACPRPVSGHRPNEEDYRMYYYVGSTLRVEWTAQHSCGGSNKARCEIILQYMCNDTSPGIRDGYPPNNQDPATETIPETEVVANGAKYGQHETFAYWERCKTRERNTGLYIADRTVGNQARATRQNQGGTRYGYECAEERDYYPYWHPTPWRDIAVFTYNMSRCDFYKNNSQNVANKGECFTKTGGAATQNNVQACLSAGNEWKIASAWGIAAPECLSADLIASRDNHLGNSVNGETARYDWTIPNLVNKACVLRIRYNMSASEIAWETDSTRNGVNSPIKQDPFADFGGFGHPLSLAINTNQVSRTFQDRSYVFEIRARPNNVPSNARIYNLNVRGKRGNIVDTYPAVEYDFVPNYLEVHAYNDYVHIQWTGSDYNEDQQNNDGEGGPPDYDANNNPTNAARADRSNMIHVQTADSLIPRPANQSYLWFTDKRVVDDAMMKKMAFLGQPIDDPVKCIPNYNTLLTANNNDAAAAIRDVRNCAKLSGVPQPYFDAGLVQFRANGIHHYASSRNNNFSNRQQKGTIVVYGGDFNAASSMSIAFSVIVIVTFVLTFLF